MLSTLRSYSAFLYGALALLLISGMIFTRSRAGITLTILAILTATFTFGRRIGGNNVYGVTGTIITFVLGIGANIGLAPAQVQTAASDPIAKLESPAPKQIENPFLS